MNLKIKRRLMKMIEKIRRGGLGYWTSDRLHRDFDARDIVPHKVDGIDEGGAGNGAKNHGDRGRQSAPPGRHGPSTTTKFSLLLSFRVLKVAILIFCFSAQLFGYFEVEIDRFSCFLGSKFWFFVIQVNVLGILRSKWIHFLVF